MNVNNNWTLFGSSLFRTFTDSVLTGEANTHITSPFFFFLHSNKTQQEQWFNLNTESITN